MSWLSQLFSPTVKSIEPAWQRQTRQQLAGLAKAPAYQRISRAGEAYPGQLTAGLSDLEKQAIGLGQQAMSQPSLASMLANEPLYQASRQQLMSTLTGTYDPVAGAYYQGLRNQVMRELQDAQARLAAQTSARDAFFGGGRISAAGRLQEGALNTLTQELGRLYENERARQLQAAQLGGQMGYQQAIATTTEPWQRAQYAAELGALPRAIEQAELDARYQEWLRQLSDLGLPLDVLMSVATYAPNVAVGTSPIGSLAGLAKSFGIAGSDLAKAIGGIGRIF